MYSRAGRASLGLVLGALLTLPAIGLAAEEAPTQVLIEDVNVEAGSGVFGVTSVQNTSVIAGQAQALLPLIRNYSEERLVHTRQTLAILEQFVSMAAGMPGRKSVLYVSDGLSLRPGEAWKTSLYREIQNRNLFLLFWSKAAADSKWVEWEWQTALVNKGKQDIQIHLLETNVSPPEELSDLHFGDVFMDVRSADSIRSRR